MPKNPLIEIKNNLSGLIPGDLIQHLPKKWEKIGDILILKIEKSIKNYEKIIAENYACLLNCKGVFKDTGGISGSFRKPSVKWLYGSKDAVTIHRENKIRYKLDISQLMFSSGNMDERIRMANSSNENETVVDLFAGIGYFSIPMAVYSNPKRIYACEINPFAYKFLCENILLNDVSDIVRPILGDNRVVAPNNVADRIIMGYWDDTQLFLKTAFSCLKNSGGIIHYHIKLPDILVPHKPFEEVENKIKKFKKKAVLMNFKKVKSYAPGIIHAVLDIKIEDL
ncbi:MAG: class I SAM-dependent methyltransferase family protein [Candidatus Thermoplasmatota archaeon]|nr:class I SAM-dependent methyltransferase family protein [Candidatus Thermoplasmatota archaeon]